MLADDIFDEVENTHFKRVSLTRKRSMAFDARGHVSLMSGSE